MSAKRFCNICGKDITILYPTFNAITIQPESLKIIYTYMDLEIETETYDICQPCMKRTSCGHNIDDMLELIIKANKTRMQNEQA